MIPYFFGYGSLVNRATHAYPNAAPAVARGWRRGWIHTSGRPYAYLSAIRDPSAEITGLVAAVPGADWGALDAREHAYERIEDSGRIEHTAANVSGVSIYAISPEARQSATQRHPVLLSYLDVVVQGYLREFGAQGVTDFFATTSGWDAPILNDRKAPIYPRHQTLTGSETQMVDAALAALNVTFVNP